MEAPDAPWKARRRSGSMEYRKAGIGDIGSLADLRSDQIVQEGGSLCADIVDELKKQFENEISGDMITIRLREAGPI